MRSIIGKVLLALGAVALLIQFGTHSLCLAAEVAKTDQKTDPVAELPATGLLPNALLSLNAEDNPHLFSRYALLVDKARRTLTVWENDGEKIHFVAAFPADMGAQAGDKVAEGDQKTPEGIYFFQTTLEGRKVDFSKYGARIFTMDYPNYFDRLEKKNGHGIWLHAVPDTVSLQRGSRGCVVVRNSVIEQLAKYIELQHTPIVVVDTVDYLPEKDWFSLRQTTLNWLESWRKAWAAKDIDNYMALYADVFRSNHMNKAQWRRYKEGLNARYKFIEVSLRNVQAFAQGTKVVFRFLQDYASDQKKDLGAKIIYAMKNAGGAYEIVGENWLPVTNR